MRITEVSSPFQPQLQIQSDQHFGILSQIESSVKQAEAPSALDKPSLNSISADLRRSLSQLSQLSPFPNSVKLHIWKLSYRLWNACVDLANTSSVLRSSNEHAGVRHAAADLLFLAGDVTGVPSPAIKSASFYYKTGLIWHDLRNFDLASTCFERASGLVSKLDLMTVVEEGERKLLLDLNIARSRTAWETSDRNLAAVLLNRAKSLLFGLPEHFKSLANQYLAFGKSELSRNETDALSEAAKLMNEALDLYEKGLGLARVREERLDLTALRHRTLRIISAVHLQMGEFESVIKCVKVLREGETGESHPSLPVLAMKAWLGLGRYAEAEKELKGMVVHKGIPEGIWVSAVEAYFEAAGTAGADTAKEVFLGLMGRCHVSAGSAVRVIRRVVGDGGGVSKGRTKVAAELVSDERVVALFKGEVAEKQRKTMHAMLWNCAADHFRLKDYETSAEMFEKSMLYIPYDIENSGLLGKGYRVLCLCYLGLSVLDRAEEYINEAEKHEPNVACAFLKFKIFLQKNNHAAAISQIQSMTACLDFTPDFLSLSAHEAVACRAFPVAIASLSNLLGFYESGKLMATAEVVVLRNIVAIIIQESGHEPEVLGFMKRARDRAAELGTDSFFGAGEVGKRELNWFAVTSWNIGTRMGKERKFELCSEFLILASGFYGAMMVDAQVEENAVMVCKSLVLGVSAMLATENDTGNNLSATKVKEAKELLDRATKILNSKSAEKLSDDESRTFDAQLFFVYTFCSYEIYGRLKDSGSQQQLVKIYASSKACSPNHLLQIGLYASQGPWFNYEVANFALNKCLSDLLSSFSPDYQTAAVILRKLITLASVNKGETDDDAVYGLYKQASRMMVGLKSGEYPMDEGKWLATTAWNRAAIPVRLGEIDAAKKWMDVGLELARHISGTESYIACMEDFLNNTFTRSSVQ